MDIRSYFGVIKPKQQQMIQLNEKSWVICGELPNGIYTDNFNDLWNLHPKKYGQIKLFDRIVDCPRWQQTYMRSYWFSGINHECLPLPDEFKPYLEWANSLGYGEFNIALVNWYEDGGQYIGRHADNEPQIVPNSPILSVSLGCARTFRIREKNTNDIVKDIEMPHGTVLIMGGEMQKHFLHEVPKVTGKKAKEIGKRINITFRQMRNA